MENMTQSTSLLKQIDSPEDLRRLAVSELPQLAAEIRREIIETVAENGGHLAPCLGVVELTMAIHYVFNTPDDKLIWDVGHQAYAHKLLTGRRDRFRTLRQYQGISGFPKREESPYDSFDTGHRLHLDLRQPRHRRRSGPEGRSAPLHCRDRRRFDDRRHGL